MIYLVKAFQFATKLLNLLQESRKEQNSSVELHEKALKFRKFVQTLGPTYVKFTQILSVRYDIFPQEVCEELQYLLDEGEEIHFTTILELLKRRLGADKYKKIRTIEREPIGVASLGQVHKAYLRNGDVVAIKVERPEIQQIIVKDLTAIRFILSALSIIPKVKKVELVKYVEEFEYWTVRELDYILEGHNIEEFGANFRLEKRIRVPKVYWDLTADKVLTTEFITGASGKLVVKTFKDNYPDKVVSIGKITIDKKRLIKIFAETTFTQTFIHGFAHGDPHPSNIIASGDNEVTLIDFGIVAKLNTTQTNQFKNFVEAMIKDDPEAVVKCMLETSESNADVNIEQLKIKVTEMVSKYQSASFKEYSITRFALGLMYASAQQGIRWPRYFTILGKIVMTYDGIMQSLDPNVNLFEEYRPLFKKYETDQFTKDFKIEKMALNMKDMLEKFSDFAQNAPATATDILENYQKEGVRVKVINEKHSEIADYEKKKLRMRLWVFILVLLFFGIIYLVKGIDNFLVIAVLLSLFLIFNN